MIPLFNIANPLPAAMWALFLVAFFSFLRKSNLVADSPRVTSGKLPYRRDFVLTFVLTFLKIAWYPHSADHTGFVFSVQ